jgi:hypothetical protein
VGEELIRFNRVADKWSVSDRVKTDVYDVRSCFVLSSGRILVVTWEKVIFYTAKLKHIKTIGVEDINAGLEKIRQLKKVEGTDSSDFLMLADIYLYRIESQGVKSKHTGEDNQQYNFIVTSVSVTDDETDPQFVLTSIQDKTIVLEKHNLNYSGLVSLAQDKCLARDLVIQNFTVIARL